MLNDMVSPSTPLSSEERQLREFIAQRGADLDAQAVVYNLSHTSRDVIGAIDAAVLTPAGLTHAGYVLLITLWITGPRETRELAVAQRVTKGAIVSAVHTLSAAGLVRRVRSTEDRRLVSVVLTEKGQTVIERVHDRWHQWEQLISSELSRDDQRQFVACLRRLSARSRELAASKSNKPAKR
jgi:DNA-binding MarR family transcriptional regulator